MCKRMPFIAINEYNCKGVKASTLRCLITYDKYVAKMNKKHLVERYNEFYGYAMSEGTALCFVRAICKYNGFVFDYDEWLDKYRAWKNSGCSYSIHFF